MEFEEFVDLRAVELLRFAHVLTGSPEQASDLVVDTVVAARPNWAAVQEAGRPFAVLRVGVSRAYLADDRSVGADEPAPEFASLTPRQRAVLVLGTFAGQTDDEIAAALQIVEAQVAADREESLAALGFDDGDERALRELLDDFADSVTPATAAVQTALSGAPDGDDSRETLAALFGVAEPDAPAGPPVPHAAEPEFQDVGVRVPEVPASPAVAAPPVEAVTKPVAAPATVPDSPPDLRHRGKGSRIGRALLLVAIVVVATALAVLVTKRTNDPSAAAPRTVAPTTPSSASPVALAGATLHSSLDRTLPGGRVLGEFFRSGPRTVTGAVYTVAVDRQLVVNAVCSGSGGATIGPVTIERCDGTPVAAAVATRSIRTVTVRTAASTTWRFVVVDSPPIATNAALRYPSSSAMSGSSATDRAARTSGDGSASVDLVSGTPQQRAAVLRVVLTCTGGGLRLATGDASLTGGVITTCYRGWAYEFDVARALLPGTLQITAPSSTSWSVLVVRA